MIDSLNRLVADKCEAWVYYTSAGRWTIHLKTERDGMTLDVREFGASHESVEDVFFRALAKFSRITGAAPELLPPRLEAPKAETPYTPFTEVDKAFDLNNDTMPF